MHLVWAVKWVWNTTGCLLFLSQLLIPLPHQRDTFLSLYHLALHAAAEITDVSILDWIRYIWFQMDITAQRTSMRNLNTKLSKHEQTTSPTWKKLLILWFYPIDKLQDTQTATHAKFANANYDLSAQLGWSIYPLQLSDQLPSFVLPGIIWYPSLSSPLSLPFYTANVVRTHTINIHLNWQHIYHSSLGLLTSTLINPEESVGSPCLTKVRTWNKHVL